MKYHAAITPDFAKQLFELLRSDVDLLSTLNELLTSELQQITMRQYDSLSAILNQKNTLMTRVHNNHKQRTQLLNNAGINQAKPLDFIQQFLPERPRETLSQLRKEVKQLTRKNVRINEKIGKLINTNQASIKQVMDSLQRRETHSTTYAQDGKTNAIRSNRIMTQA